MLKKVDTINSNKQNLEKNIDDLDKMIPDTSIFTETQDFNRSKKINFDGRIAVTSKKLWIKKQVENAIDLGDKNGEKKFKTYFI